MPGMPNSTEIHMDDVRKYIYNNATMQNVSLKSASRQAYSIFPNPASLNESPDAMSELRGWNYYVGSPTIEIVDNVLNPVTLSAYPAVVDEPNLIAYDQGRILVTNSPGALRLLILFKISLWSPMISTFHQELNSSSKYSARILYKKNSADWVQWKTQSYTTVNNTPEVGPTYEDGSTSIYDNCSYNSLTPTGFLYEELPVTVSSTDTVLIRIEVRCDNVGISNLSPSSWNSNYIINYAGGGSKSTPITAYLMDSVGVGMLISEQTAAGQTISITGQHGLATNIRIDGDPSGQNIHSS